jgi:hypothetical protein
LVVTSLFGYPRPIQDRLDQRAMLRHFDLPTGLRLVEYEGYPAVVGFGQREGLNLRAVFQLTERQAENLERRLVQDGWLPLPVPAETRRKLQGYVDPSTLALSAGLYQCRTAGNDVLRARETRPCAEADWLNDAIFGVFDADTHRLHLQVGSGY